MTTWLHRIVVNASLDLRRRRAARPADSSAELDELALPGPRQLPDGAAAADARLDVDAALRTLPPPQRAALVLVDMLGYSVADAAAILGVSDGTVKSRCARGRTRLLPYLAHLRPGHSAGGNQPVAGGVSAEPGGGA